jgi:hypothetical protein
MDKCPVCRAPVESFVTFGGEGDDESTDHVIPRQEDDDDGMDGIELTEM